MSDQHLQGLLETLLLVEELNPENRERLAQKAQFMSLKAGEKLNAAQEHRWLLYLIEGTLGVLSNGKTETFQAGSARARQPIFSDTQLKDQAVAGSSGRLLRLDRNLYDTLKQHQNKAGYELEDVELSDTENEIFLQIYQACLSKTLTLPVLPEVAVKVQGTVNDPNVDVTQLARIIQMDLGITAGLLQAANSALYAGSQAVAHVRDAIVRLGLDATRKLVLSIALKQVFQSQSPVLRDYMHELWERSVHISALSYAIASYSKRPGIDPEHAMLAGLLCDIGEVPVLNYLQQQGLNPSHSEIVKITTKLHDMVGEMVVNSWGMGPDISQVARESRDWQRKTTQNKPDYCDVVIVARLYRELQKFGETGLPRYDQVPAFTRLGLPPPLPETPLECKAVTDSLAEINAILTLFQAK